MKVRILSLLFVTAFFSTQSQASDFNGHVNVSVQSLSEKGQKGQIIFNQNCASCHGVDASGTRIGPPLIHDIYNPGHHNNGSFSRAVSQGVQQHHWPYGNMPPQKHIGFSDLSLILAFVREAQQQNGITYKQH